MNYRLLVQKKRGSRRCRGELVELTVDDVWQIADAGDQELQRLARNNRRGNLELGAEDNSTLLYCLSLGPSCGGPRPWKNYTCIVIRCSAVRRTLCCASCSLCRTILSDHRQATRCSSCKSSVAVTTKCSSHHASRSVS